MSQNHKTNEQIDTKYMIHEQSIKGLKKVSKKVVKSIVAVKPKVSTTTKSEENLNGFSRCIRKAILSVAYPMEFKTKPSENTSIAIWYLTPEYQFIESLTILLISLLILFAPTYYSNNPEQVQKLNQSMDNEQSLIVDMFETGIKYALSIDLLLHIYYKFAVDITINGKGYLFLLQPCAVNQLLLLTVLYYPSLLTRYSIQILLALSCGSLNAIAFPDTSALTWLAVKHFWFQHILIFLLPFWYLIKYSSEMNETLYFYNGIEAQAISMIYHFVILNTTSILSGVNLNYMMSPPNVPICIKSGKYYRITMTFVMTFGHLVCGYFIPKLIVNFV